VTAAFSKPASRALERLNALSAADAAAELLACCGASAWARDMAAHRPFKSVDDVLAAAESAGDRLTTPDWLEAIRAHPRIGERAAPAHDARSAAWSAREQAGATASERAIRDAITEGNRDYERKFGHQFIIRASGRGGAEMLDALKARLLNDAGTELKVAAGEQRQITRRRLTMLLTATGGSG
jgi:OHCU decarboxylase